MTGRRRSGSGRIVTLAVGCAGLLATVAVLCGCLRLGAAAEDAAATAAAGAQPAATLRQAADALAAAGSSAVSTAMEMDSGGTRITITGEGGFDYAEGTGMLRLTLPEPREDGGDRPVVEVFAPGELYMKNRGAGVPADKWVRVDVTEIADGNIVTGGATDPLTAAALLRGVVSATEVGEVRLNGEAVRHYRGVADIAVAAQAASGAAARQLAAAAAGAGVGSGGGEAGGFAETAVRFDAYLDEEGVPHRVRHRFVFAGGDAGARVDVASTVELSAFGSPVEVAMPEPGEAYDGTVA